MEQGGYQHEASELGTRIPPLAHPRDRARLHRRGRLGASCTKGRPRTSRRCSSCSPPPIPPRRNPSRPACSGSLRDLLGQLALAGQGLGRRPRGRARPSCRFPVRAKPRWPGGCRRSCAGPRRASTSARCPSNRFIDRRRVRRGDPNQTVHGVMHLAWVERGRRPLPGPDGRLRQAPRPLGKGYMALIKPSSATGSVHPVPQCVQDRTRSWNTRSPQ